MTNTPLQDIQQMQADVAIFDAWLHDGNGVEITFGPGDTRPSLATLIADLPNVSGQEFPTSNYQTVALPMTPLTAADAAAFTAGGVLVVNTHETLIAAVALTSKAARYKGGKISTAGFTLSHPALIDAPCGLQIFDQTPAGGITGQVTFTGKTKVDYCWWGADNTGNTNGAVELKTRQAAQYAEIAIDANWGSIVDNAPGFYIVDAGQAIVFRNSFHISRPGTVRFDYDPATVAVQSDGSLVGIFSTGNPVTMVSAGSWLAGHAALAGNTNLITSRDPATCPVGLIWIGIDIVSSHYGQAFLGANKFVNGLNWQYVVGGTVMDCWIVGCPNDGLAAYFGTNKIVRVKSWINGYSGGAANGDSTRNNISTVGIWDITTPSLTSNGTLILGCDVRGAANSGIAGGLNGDWKLSGGVNIGNRTGVEGSGQSATTATQWTANTNVALHQLFYVPGTSPAKSPVGLGGNLFIYTVAGETGTVAPVSGGLGVNVVDNTATCQFVGVMPDNGRIPSVTTISDYTIDGTLPLTLNVPYLGVINVPASLDAGARSNAAAFTWNGGNESTIRVSNVKIRNCGYDDVDSFVFGIAQNNGCLLYIEGLEFENCVGLSTGGGSGLMRLYLGTASFGTVPNQHVRVTISGIRALASLGLAGTTLALLFIWGNINYYDISGVESDGSNGDLIYIGHCVTTPPASGYVLESGRIAHCYTAGQEYEGIVLRFDNNFTWQNPILLDSNRLFGINNAGAQLYYAPVHLSIPNALTAASGKLILRDNEFGCGAQTNYPISVDNANLPANCLKLVAHDNEFDSGPWKLSFAGGSPAIVNSTAPFLSINANDNGIPGQRRSRGTATPAAGTWSWGDTQDRDQPVAAGVDRERCTTNPGATITGPMTGAVVTGAGVNGTNTVTCTVTSGALPAAGEYITFGAGPTGIYYILNVTGLVLTLKSNLNNTLAAGTAINYSTAVTFKAVALAA